VLSADGPDQVEQVQFVEKVSTSQVQVPPGIVMGEEEMMMKLRDREGPLLSVTEKIKKGTKEVQGKGTGKFIWPVLSPSITSTFGERWGKMHKGIDMTGNRVIMAADNGKVVNTGSRHDYGNYIIIDHMNGDLQNFLKYLAQ
jgi:murein DD-endopeptidase MepM/ murein hydrolase activator NlpD